MNQSIFQLVLFVILSINFLAIGSFSNKLSNLLTTTIEKSVDVNFFVHANNTLIVNSSGGLVLSGGASAILLNRNITLFNQILTNQFKNGNISTSGEAKASIIHDLEDKGIKLNSYKLVQNISLRKVKKQFITGFESVLQFFFKLIS